ncbi:MAG: WG repeat-containing protein [Chitinophagaceae bacterium]
MGKNSFGDVRSVKFYYGLFDINGKVLIPCKYDYLSWVNDSLLVLTTGGLGTNQALFNKKGKQLTGFEYMVFGKFLEGSCKSKNWK